MRGGTTGAWWGRLLPPPPPPVVAGLGLGMKRCMVEAPPLPMISYMRIMPL